MAFDAPDRIAVMYLDNDGGWGGSARSLTYLLENLDRGRFDPVVVLRKPGPMEARCAALGIDCHVVPELTAFRPGDRKTLVAYALYLWQRLRTRSAPLDRIVAERKVGLIHVNHEGLALAGQALARRHRLPWISHIRTQLTPSLMSRWLYRQVIKGAAAVVFIAEPVRDHFARLVGTAFDPSKGQVVHNIAPDMHGAKPSPLFAQPADRFRVLSLTNFSPNRGVDRIVDVAAELARRGETGFAFYLCGRPANRSALTGRVLPYYDEILQRVADLGLRDMVFFPGHVDAPERALAACDAVVKLTRQANPWGRDIMEAMAAGLPVVTLGSFQGFVENGVNGYVDAEFDPARIADHLSRLARDPVLQDRIASANRGKAHRLFHGPDRARDIAAIYDRVLYARDPRRLAAAATS